MPERPRSYEPEPDPYWQEDLAIGELSLSGRDFPLRLQLHHSREPYARRERPREIVPLYASEGTRLYLHGKPYIKAIGRGNEVGKAQAWAYDVEHTAVLWEAYLADRFQADPDPVKDANLNTLWSSWEAIIEDACPNAYRLVTPSWEPIYERELYQNFLRARGFQQLSAQAFVKELHPTPFPSWKRRIL